MIKRIISCLASVALLSSLCVANVSAEVEMATVTVDYVEVTKEEFESDEFMGEALPDGYGAYLVTAGLSGIGDLNCTISAKKYNGRRLSNFTLVADVDDINNVNQDYTMDWGATLTTSMGLAAGTSTYNAIFLATDAASAYPNTNGASVSDSIPEAITLLFVAKPGTTLTLSAYGQVNTYKSSLINGDDEPFTGANVTCTPSITLGGSSEPTDPKGTVIAEKDGKQAVYSGSVDGTQIQGTTKFRITYNGSTEALKANGTTKDIMRNANQILDGVIGEGATLSGKLHFGVWIAPEYVETDGDQFTVEAIN